MTDHQESLVREHVRLFNQGVTSGDFGPMLEAFAEDAVLTFEGIPVGPFVGKQAIAAAYREQPPDDEIEIGDISIENGAIVVPFTWRRAPSTGGTMRIQEHDGRITGLLIAYGMSE